ncbi:hypothetical protein BDZ91DRAFT_717770, partial [Kalaharituber pfeilii]
MVATLHPSRPSWCGNRTRLVHLTFLLVNQISFIIPLLSVWFLVQPLYNGTSNGLCDHPASSVPIQSIGAAGRAL